MLSLPLLKVLKESGVEIAFWTFQGQADFVGQTGWTHRVWSIRPGLFTFVPDLLRNWLQARKFRADAIIDLEQTANFSALVAWSLGIQHRVGFMCGKPARESLFTHLVALTAGRHMSENGLCAARQLGFNAPSTDHLPARPRVNSNHVRRASIVLNPNSSDLGRSLRQWPESHWIELANGLLAKYPEVELVLPGLASEHPLNERIRTGTSSPQRIRNLAGKTSLAELSEILAGSQLVISVDSGIMHLAAWCDVPVIGLFGPETPAVYAPLSPKVRVVWAGLACSPCCTVATEKHTRCRDNVCMQQIQAGQVLRVARDILERESKTHAA